ncbi:MAG: hypothetical protein AAFP18_01945 [Bacteroidota bacterium]
MLTLFALMLILEADDGTADSFEVKRQMEQAFGPIGHEFEIVHNEWSRAVGDSLATYAIVLPESTFDAVVDRLDLGLWVCRAGRCSNESWLSQGCVVTRTIDRRKRRLDYQYADF